jgi:PPE-repeat protein
MDYGALPPEINSARIYFGPGSAPMVAAAASWNGLAAELSSAATAYEAAVSTLTGEEWLGPASGAMAEAANSYVSWMSATAAQAQEAASQASAAAAAYENALAATVPPQLIAVNRAELAQLLATNVIGQNTNAIAALEAQYGEMWAQDASAMYGYAANSATATKLTAFVPPAQTTNPAGQALQSAAVAQAASTSAGTSAQSTSSLSSVLQGLSLTGSGITGTASGFTVDPNSILGSILTGIGGSSTVNPQWFITAFRNFAGPAYNVLGMPYFSTGMANSMLSISKGLAPAAAKAGAEAAGAAAAKGLGGLGGLLGGGGQGVAAGLGQAASVGKLSVPTTWSLPAAVPSHAAPLPISTISAAPESGAGNLLGGMPLAGVGGGAGANSGPRYGFRPTVMARPPFAG